MGVFWSASVSFLYSEGTIAIPEREDKIAAKGSLRVSCIVEESITFIPVIGETLLAKGEAISLFCTLSIEASTSLASIFDPSWNTTLECKLKVYVRPSEETSHDFANPGCTLKSLSIFVSPS